MPSRRQDGQVVSCGPRAKAGARQRSEAEHPIRVARREQGLAKSASSSCTEGAPENIGATSALPGRGRTGPRGQSRPEHDHPGLSLGGMKDAHAKTAA